uniref:Glycosyltransferase n=1 Tax=viral metagenome TaxID=1070528 RepID=A0A6C0C2U0_9ZZZZ
MTFKIGVLIPSTSHMREWKQMEETSLYNIFLKTFLTTYCKKYFYTLYLTIDDDDRIFSNPNEKIKLIRFIKIMKNVELKFISTKNIPKGWVTHMWNRAFKEAYDDNCDYFFQSGDDIQFLNNDWVSNSIKLLQENNDIGLTGPLDLGRIKGGNIQSQPGGSRFIQTQSFVSRKHMDIFGYYFPPEIKNWFCDDWITKVYYPKYFYQTDNYIINIGGTPRYKVIGEIFNPDDPTFKACNRLIEQDYLKLKEYVKNQKKYSFK